MRDELQYSMAVARPTVTVGIPTYNRATWLKESIESVLAQTHSDFQLLICDNASEDETPDVVESFADPRIRYVRSDRNVGMIANFNRVIQLAETDFLLILPDDDVLYPEHLHSAVAVLEQYPNVGVVHTSYDVIDSKSHVAMKNVALLESRGSLTIESRDEYLERSMKASSWTVCWASALFRTSAIAKAGGLRAEEFPSADVSFLMRIALDWSFACIARSLVACRVHADAATIAALGSFVGPDRDLDAVHFDKLPKNLFERRIQFLEEARLPHRQAERYRALARTTLRRESVRNLAGKAGLGAPWKTTSAELLGLIRSDPRTLLVPATWKLVIAQLGGRRAKRILRRVEATLRPDARTTRNH